MEFALVQRDYSDPCTSKKGGLSHNIALMGLLSFLVIKGPAHILLETVNFPSAAKTLGVGGWVGRKNAFKNCSNQNYCQSDLGNICSNALSILPTAFSFHFPPFARAWLLTWHTL